MDDILFENKNAGGIAWNWCMYGSSGKETKEPGGVVQRFLMRSLKKGNECVKTIVIPECVKDFSQCHYPNFKAGFYNVDTVGRLVPEWYNPISEFHKMRINHYFTKSKEEWISRRSRGRADIGVDCKRTIDEFYIHDNNDIFDDVALKLLKYYRDNI